MDNSQLKDALIDLLNRIETEIIAFDEGLTAKQKNEKGSLRKWSARDTISHLVFWGNHFNSQINRARCREKVPHVGDYINQVNDGVFIEHMDKPFAETLANFNKSFRDSVEILKSFPADEINNKKKYEYLNDRTLLDNALGTLGWHVVHHISDFYYKNGKKEKAISQQEIITMRLNVFPSWKANAIYNLACFFRSEW